jgi:hypothetical protein
MVSLGHVVDRDSPVVAEASRVGALEEANHRRVRFRAVGHQ